MEGGERNRAKKMGERDRERERGEGMNIRL
jgi:hypothetical protein